MPEPRFKAGDRVKFTPDPGCIVEVIKTPVWRNYPAAGMPPGYWYSVRAEDTAICQSKSAAAHEEWLELVEQQKPKSAIWPWIILGILILIGRRKKR